MLSFTYQFKLKPSKKQIQDIEMYLDVCREVYNWNHRERKDWIKSRKSPVDRCSIEKEYIIPASQPFPNFYIQSNNLTLAKKIHLHLKQVHSNRASIYLEKTRSSLGRFFQSQK